MEQPHYRPWQHTANSSPSIWCVRIAGSYSHMPRRPFEIHPRRAVIRDGDAGFLLHGSIALARGRNFKIERWLYTNRFSAGLALFMHVNRTPACDSRLVGLSKVSGWRRNIYIELEVRALMIPPWTHTAASHMREARTEKEAELHFYVHLL